MADFNPVAEAKQLIAVYRAALTDGNWERIDEEVGSPKGVDTLVEYIDELVIKLRATLWYVERIADEWDDLRAQKLLHDIGHVLDD
jgi:hypothetical protein